MPRVTQADRIRRYVLARYVDPARISSDTELTISAGDVCRSMGLQGRAPNVCSVLGSRKLFDMAGLRLLDRAGPRQSTTTTFRYVLVEPGTGVESAPACRKRAAEQRVEELRPAAAPQRGRAESGSLTVVIACAGTKSASAGHLALADGTPVKFVADPRVAPTGTSMNYRHPDGEACPG